MTEVRYSSGENDLYQLPVCFTSAFHDQSARTTTSTRGLLQGSSVGDEEGYLCDATFDARFLNQLYQLVTGKEIWQGKAGLVSGLKSMKIDDDQ